jgi:Cysteine-rich secretory protein family
MKNNLPINLIYFTLKLQSLQSRSLFIVFYFTYSCIHAQEAVKNCDKPNSYYEISHDTVYIKEIMATLNILNNIRKAVGLDTVSISTTLSKGCYDHAKYLAINKDNPLTGGMNAHKELPILEGYTKEGEVAAKNSVIHFVKPTEAIDGWIQTFYHRIPLFQPNLKEIGIGFYQKRNYIVSLVDCTSGVSGKSLKDLVCYPNENQSNIPLKMGPEIPHPVGQEGSYGFPITIYFCKRQKITSVVFALSNEDGELVDCYLSTPEKPASYFPQWNCICAIPQKPLKANTRYFVSIICNVNNSPFKKEYSFQTTKLQ